MKQALLAIAFIALCVLAFFQARRKATQAPLPPQAVGTVTPAPAETPLTDAVQASLRDAASKARIEAVLAKGANPNSTDQSGRPALLLALRNNDIPAMELLLAKGADPNARDRELHWTPLMHAAFLAAREPVYLKAFNLLLAKGADPNAEKDGTTALHAAVNNTDAFAKDAPVIEALLRAGAKPGGVPSAGPMPTISSPMVLAAWNGKTAAALALARGGAAIAEGVRTARNNHHPELAAALEKLANPPAPAPKAAPRQKKRH